MSIKGQLSVTIKGRSLKNELNYNRDTWAEWTKSAGVTGDSTGLQIVGDGTAQKSGTLNTNLKPNTKYGLLLSVVNNTFTGNLSRTSHYTGVSEVVVSLGQTGNIKKTFTTQASISNNILMLYGNTTETGTIKIRDIRVFELPTGSEIEADFTNATTQAQIDALAQKYPYIKGDGVKSTLSIGNTLRTV